MVFPSVLESRVHSVNKDQDAYLRLLLVVEVANDTACEDQGVLIIYCQMIRHSRYFAVHVSASQIFSRDLFTSGGLDKRRTSQKDRSLLLNNNTFVGHGRHICTTSCAGSQDNSHLRNAHRRHVGLVVEDTSKVLSIGEDIQLTRQVGSTRFD